MVNLRFLALAAFLAAAPAARDACAQDPPRPAYDRQDPASLNEAAIERLREGDARTAAILLERAARLAPHDPRIARNLRELRAWLSGAPAPASSPQAPAVRGPGPAVPPAPPAPWPPRRDPS